MIVIAGPYVMYCYTQFLPGDAGKDVAKCTKDFVDESSTLRISHPPLSKGFSILG